MHLRYQIGACERQKIVASGQLNAPIGESFTAEVGLRQAI